MEAISELPTWQVTASPVALALIDFMQQWEAPCFMPRDSTSRIRGYGAGRAEAVWCLHYSKEKSQICWTPVLLPPTVVGISSGDTGLPSLLANIHHSGNRSHQESGGKRLKELQECRSKTILGSSSSANINLLWAAMTSALQQDYLWIGLLLGSLGVRQLLVTKYTHGCLYVCITKLQLGGAWGYPNI